MARKNHGCLFGFGIRKWKMPLVKREWNSWLREYLSLRDVGSPVWRRSDRPRFNTIRRSRFNGWLRNLRRSFPTPTHHFPWSCPGRESDSHLLSPIIEPGPPAVRRLPVPHGKIASSLCQGCGLTTSPSSKNALFFVVQVDAGQSSTRGYSGDGIDSLAMGQIAMGSLKSSSSQQPGHESLGIGHTTECNLPVQQNYPSDGPRANHLGGSP